MSVAEKIDSEIIQPEKKEIIQPKKMGLLVENPVYKPFRYPWCYDAWLTQQRIHWLPEEVPLGDDVRDWQKNLTVSEKNLLTQIFRFFSQAQSINIFLPADVHKKELHQIHFQAWKKGLKSLYYCRSKSIQRAENVNNDLSTNVTKNESQESKDYEECLSCQ